MLARHAAGDGGVDLSFTPSGGPRGIPKKSPRITRVPPGHSPRDPSNDTMGDPLGPSWKIPQGISWGIPEGSQEDPEGDPLEDPGETWGS
jgi:hypothetical protein